MQLVDQKKQDDQEELSPAIYTALVDSLFQNFIPTLAGTASATIAAVMTALKTGGQSVWPCAVWISIVGIARAIQMRKYELERRGSALTPERAAWWEPHYKVLADVYASALGLWCFVVVLGSDDPPMFGTTLLDEYERARDHLGLTAGQLHALARASIDASFAPVSLKR